MDILFQRFILPEDSPKRVGKMTPKYITIHEVSLGEAQTPAEYDFEHYYNMLLDTHDESRINVGYHFLIEANIGDQPSIYQFLETNVSTKHTGNSLGNMQSIGIERLVNVNTNMELAVRVQAKLSALLMWLYNIPITNVVPHQYWSGKECPSRLLKGMYGGWNGFLENVKYYYTNHKIL